MHRKCRIPLRRPYLLELVASLEINGGRFRPSVAIELLRKASVQLGTYAPRSVISLNEKKQKNGYVTSRLEVEWRLWLAHV